MKQPISTTKLKEFVESIDGTLHKFSDSHYRISVAGLNVDVFPTTGTFVDRQFNVKDIGFNALSTYIETNLHYTPQNTHKTSVNKETEVDVGKRIAELENRLELLTKRLTLLDETVSKII